MVFDTDEAARTLKEFEHFMRDHAEPQWAQIFAKAQSELSAVEHHYNEAVDWFLDFVDRIWGGAMGGGLFEFLDSPSWLNRPREDIAGFERLREKLSALRDAARKSKEGREL